MNSPGACASCGAPASVSVLEDGVRRFQCRRCLDARSGRLGLVEISQAMRRSRRGDGICPYCGTSSVSAVETGIVGCPLCYEAHRDALTRARALESAYPDREGW